MQYQDKAKLPSSLAFPMVETSGKVHINLPPAELIEMALIKKEGKLTSSGSLSVATGKFTGRSPKDRYLVMDDLTRNTVSWGEINLPFDKEKFGLLLQKMRVHLADKELFIRDAYAGADPNHRLNLKVINTQAWQNLFCHNMFLRPTEDELRNFSDDFTIICAPEFEAIPEEDGTSSPNFVIINLSERIILIGGTGYAGEIKKGVFSVLNFLLPHGKNILSMHCSANVGSDGESAIFFGLSGTGKTTLSADPDRKLVGDDEHGWTDEGIFNFEGGCYAKVIDLSREKEPEIWDAIRFGSIVENTKFRKYSREVDFSDSTITENARTAYPINFIPNALNPSIAPHPKHIFFLTADAFGVIPPISLLDKGQAMYHFISGYTSKLAGTEMGISEPKLTFSACFGAAFLPLHPTLYALLFGEKIVSHNTKVWLVNTGWTGGPYGEGRRMKLVYTRAMISAALEGSLDKVAFERDPHFGIAVPTACPNVPAEILNPRGTWKDGNAYDTQAQKLADAFRRNFEKYRDFATDEIVKGGPI